MTETSKPATIPATEVRPGDVVHFLGRPHLIDSTSERNGFGWPIARAADGWGIALAPGQRLPVTRAAVA